MKVLVTGTSGQLGYDVMMELLKRGHEAVGADRADSDAEFEHVILDITDAEKVSETIKEVHPDAIIHCAAWTNVDAAEAPENRDAVMAVNVEGTANLAEAAEEAGAKIMYISTDYVFDGQGERPWEPDDKDFKPLNVYGESKLKGELEIVKAAEKYFIVRIAWVFGKNGNNFIKTMMKLGETHKEISVVSDQIGTPTYTFDLARLLVDMIESEKYGFYHATNEGGYISWAEFAKEIFKDAKMDVAVNPVTTAEYEEKAGKTVAKRPFNSRLDKTKLVENGFEPLPTWQDAVGRYIEEL